MAFYVGQKVVCIADNDDWTHDFDPGERPAVKKGHVYTVQAIVNFGYPALVLCEVPPKAWYSQTAFRPVVKTDISIFTAMLTPKKAKEPA